MKTLNKALVNILIEVGILLSTVIWVLMSMTLIIPFLVYATGGSWMYGLKELHEDWRFSKFEN